MIQIALVLVSIGLIVNGIKGLTPSGLKLSRKTTLTGSSGKIAGIICIVAGAILIPLFALFFVLYASWLDK